MQENRTILLVDDNPLNIDVLVDLLGDYELLVSLNAASAFELLQNHPVDLILLDIMMPDMDGLEMARHLKTQPDTAGIPILFITAKQDEQSIEEGFEAGAVDYITKPFKPRELRARVKTHLQLYTLVKELEYSANYDYLSGARNRRSFFKEAKTRFNATSIDRLFAVMLDIDKFKAVNDTYGHAVGDVMIQMLSYSIQEQLGKEMLFARMGGEEFVILTENEDESVMLQWVESLRSSVEKLEVPTEKGAVHFSVSFGVACHCSECNNIDALLDKADKALYEAKEGGRNRVIFRV